MDIFRLDFYGSLHVRTIAIGSSVPRLWRGPCTTYFFYVSGEPEDVRLLKTGARQTRRSNNFRKLTAAR